MTRIWRVKFGHNVTCFEVKATTAEQAILEGRKLVKKTMEKDCQDMDVTEVFLLAESDN